jgi:uncharacterized protein (UPF0333 family)
LVATTREYDVGDTSTEFGIPLIILLLVVFYGGTFLISLSIGKKSENADGYMTAGNNVGFGIAAGSMTATWIWASSMYAAATSGYTYGISGPIHYGLWGALMILFIYPASASAPSRHGRTPWPRSCTRGTAARARCCSEGRISSGRSSA